MALEAQEAERKYQETKRRKDEPQLLFHKGAHKEETDIDKPSQNTSSDWDLEKSQILRVDGQGNEFDDSSLDGPSPKTKTFSGQAI